MDHHSKGYHIGSIKLTNVTVADDELLVSSCPNDAQNQLNIMSSENSRDRAIVNGDKTEGVAINLEKPVLFYNSDVVPFNETAKHLGLHLSALPITADGAKSKSRKTIYSLMGTGMHGRNGLNPIVIRKIWERYNDPRSSHGLDVQFFPDIELQKLQTHEIQHMKMFQSLPKFAANILAHILVGGRPISAIIHQRMLSLLMNIRRKNGIEAEIGRRQLAMKPSSSNSWFHRTNAVANKYGLPNCFTVLEEPPWDKITWKHHVKATITDHVESSWRKELDRLTSLQYINPRAISIGRGHPVWSTSRYSAQASRQAISKVRFLTNTMMNGSNAHKMFSENATCICGFPSENRRHQILDCSIYDDLRDFCVSRMTHLIVTNYNNIITEDMIHHPDTLFLLLLDPSWFRQDIGSHGHGLPNILSEDDANSLECFGRTFCFQIYKQRFGILSEEDTDSETDTDEDNYSLHDSTDTDSSNTETED